MKNLGLLITRLSVATAAVAALAALAGCADQPAGAGGYQGTPEDFVQIYQLFQNYNYDINIEDGDAWAKDFTADGVFQDPSTCAIGRDALSNVPGHNVTPGKDLRNFHLSNPGPIRYLDRNHATVHSTVMVIRETGGGKAGGIGVTGTYDDKLTRVEGRWKFAYRFVQRPNKTSPVQCAPQVPNGFHFADWP